MIEKEYFLRHKITDLITVLGIFDIEVIKNTGETLLFQQFYALMMKHILNSMRNFLVIIASLLPVLFVVFSLIIEQQIPKPEDSPSLLISFDRYEQSKVPYWYSNNQSVPVNLIHFYEKALLQSTKPPVPIDLTKSSTDPCRSEPNIDVNSFLGCIGRRSLLELSDNYLIGAQVQESSVDNTLNVTGLFNNQAYHIPPLTLNFLSNALLKQYSPSTTLNRSINVINHPVG